jgi:hypothetical protein
VATHSIGTSSRDYSTITLWEAACPADITAGGSNENWIGEAYNDSNFNEVVLFAGTTTDSTHIVKLTTAAGQSFRDNGSVRTTALTYVGTGAGVTWDASFAYTTMIDLSENNILIEKFQLKTTPTGGGAFGIVNRSANTVIQNCIMYDMIMQPPATKTINCLLIRTNSGTLIPNSGQITVEYCTFINTSGSGTLSITAYATITVENCAFFGFTDGFTLSTVGFLAGGHNCTDLGSAPGSSNQVSKTFSNQFVSTTVDFRAKTGADLENNGTPATSYATDDISGLSRSATTPTIGAWELASAAAAASLLFKQRTLSNSFLSR